MAIYEELGITRIINGAATLTRLGGSIMPREVIGAMMEAANAYVDIEYLSERVGEEIAAMTGNEAAFVCASAAAGILLSVAGAMTGTDAAKRAQLPDASGMRDEVIVQRCASVPFEFAIRQTGAKIVAIGDERQATEDELRRALGRKTAAVFLAPKGDGPSGSIPVPRAVEIAHDHAVPVIVDAAAQLPPPENLWRFTAKWDADCAIFSGGKGLCGPQATGLIVGKKALVEAAAFHASPEPFIGRPAKVGKEELAGLYAAVKWYLSLDHEGLMRQYEETVQYFIDELSRAKHVIAERDFPSEAGQPMPRVKVTLDEEALEMSRDELMDTLLSDTPAVVVSPAGPHGFHINPQTLRPGEERIVATRLLRVLLGRELANLRRAAEEPMS